MSIEATHLGKQSAYPRHYDPSVLVAVPRQLNREQYDISDEQLPFEGYDVWHAYEFSFLLDNGLPVAGMLKIVYPCNNKFLVESKSLKLYLNAFNMEKLGGSAGEGIAKAVSMIKNDLETLLGCPVQITYFDHRVPAAEDDFTGFVLLEELLQHQLPACNVYRETPELLGENQGKGSIRWGTHLLRSNCKITHQPDWGTLYISMEGAQLPKPEDFLRYLVSLRNENHFHEEICELVYQRLISKYQPEQLMITCQYTRRGGIDINPVRVSHASLYPLHLINAAEKTCLAFRQ